MFESFLLNRTASGITEFFLLLIFFCLAGAVVMAWRGTAPRFTTYAPTLLTSLGILGTFTGIVIGLLNFDPTQLDASIGKLLDGLKTAFITSITGMGAGIFFKVLSTTLLKPAEAEPESEVGPADILSKLDEQTRILEATRDAVAGSEESSLAGQVKLLRTDLTDRHRDDRQAFEAFSTHLREQLKEVAQMLSQAATEQIVDALRQVIADFNQKITEQFGDNFKRLDASVQKLVEWQEHYRQQLEQLHALYDQSVQNITKIDSAVEHIAESSSSIPNSMEKLSGIVETASHQLSELEQHLAAFAQLRDRAVEAVPQMQAHVEEITREISASVDAASEHYKALLENSDSYLKAQDDKAQEILATFTDAGVRIQRALQAEHQQLLANSDSYSKEQNAKSQEVLAVFMDASERVQHNTQSVQQQVADSIQQMQSQVEASVNEVLGAQNQAVSQGVESLHEHMRHSASRTGEAVNAQLEALDQLMNQEIERVMNEMGRALAQIAGKFTEDYSELTEAMGQIVERGGRFR